jgi:ABC-type iron transport system FetAB permease component
MACFCRLCLGLHSQLAVAAVRCVVQLSLLGYILVPIFKLNNPWLVLAYAGFMVWVSALEAVGRPSRVYKVWLGKSVRTNDMVLPGWRSHPAHSWRRHMA